MKDEHAASLRRGIDAWNREDLDGILELLDGDIAIHLSGAFPDLKREYRGHDGFRAFWRAMHEMWRPLEMELGEVEPLDDLILTAVTFRGTGRDGIQVEQVFFFVWEFDPRTDKVIAYTARPDRDAALEAATALRAKGGQPA